MQGKNKRFTPTFRPDLPSTLCICFQDEYHLAALDKVGFCVCVCFNHYSSVYRESGTVSLFIILMLKNPIIWYHYLPHALVEVKNKRYLIFLFKSEIDVSLIYNMNFLSYNGREVTWGARRRQGWGDSAGPVDLLSLWKFTLCLFVIRQCIKFCQLTSIILKI